MNRVEQHDIDLAGQRLLRNALESLGWCVNKVEYDYGFDFDVQVFVNRIPNGIWFKVQLKSSATTQYSEDKSFISQALELDHARHYAQELCDPMLLIHADVIRNCIFWSTPQLDDSLIGRLANANAPRTITVRIPVRNALPATADQLLHSVQQIYLVLANRKLVSTPAAYFAQFLSYFPDEKRLRAEFQRKNDILKFRAIHEFRAAKKFSDARQRALLIASDPDAQIESQFSAQLEIEMIDLAEAHENDRPQNGLPLIKLAASQRLQELTKSGPSHLKFFALIARKTAELELATIRDYGIILALHQQSISGGNLFSWLNLYADHALCTRQIILKYNQCVRLARYASTFHGRWVLPDALARIGHAMASYVASRRFRKLDCDGFSSSLFQISNLIAWIAEESGGNDHAMFTAISTTLILAESTDSAEYKWAVQLLDHITTPVIKKNAVELIENQLRRWRGEPVARDRHPDPIKQIVEHMAATMGIDPSDLTHPIMKSLLLAARDNSPERVLSTCEHIVTSIGAVGPIARKIEVLFNIGTAASKLIHCSLHDLHEEGKEYDSAYAAFKSKYCDSCKDRAPRPSSWQYTEEFRPLYEKKHLQFIRAFNQTGRGYRVTDED